MESFVVEINGEEIPLRIVRRNNKNIYFRFDTDGALVVSANPRISAKKILKLVKENESSLESMYKRIKKRMDEEGEIRILGLKYDLVMDENVQDVYFDNGAIYVRNLTMLNKYLNKLTKQVFSEEIDRILDIMPGIPEFTLKVRKMKSRWGVCNYVKKTVTLNSELIKYERGIIDYVIVHEFSHFTHHDHSKAFWSLVGKYYPDYKMARKELRG